MDKRSSFQTSLEDLVFWKGLRLTLIRLLLQLFYQCFYYYHYHLRYYYRCHHCYHHHLMLCTVGLYVYVGGTVERTQSLLTFRQQLKTWLFRKSYPHIIMWTRICLNFTINLEVVLLLRQFLIDWLTVLLLLFTITYLIFCPFVVFIHSPDVAGRHWNAVMYR